MSTQNEPWICPICRLPLVKAGEKNICPYQNLEWPAPKPFKGIDVIIYTTKEREEIENKFKEERKKQLIELNKEKRKQD
jgi:hypothetical protein